MESGEQRVVKWELFSFLCSLLSFSGGFITTLELDLTSFTYGGDSLGRLPDGRLVFVPYCLPGERVIVRLLGERESNPKRRYARAELVEVLAPSPQRVTPRCAHYGECGGCHYQHLSYPGQLEAKRAILVEQLQRLGGIPDPPVGLTVPSPKPYNYRNHVQFHQTPTGALGFHRGRSEEVFPLRECHLPEVPLSAAWPQLKFEPLPGLERIGLRLGAGDELQLILESALAETPELSVEELPVSVAHVSPWGSLVLAGSRGVVMEVRGRTFQVSAGAFFQANTPVAAEMVRYLLARLPLHPGTTVLELYCGVGLFSAFLAERAGRLVGVEASPAACADFEANLNAFDNVELYEASAELVLAELALQPEVILVDPPRAGLGKDVVSGLLAMQPGVIAYVSCDPATLARDGRGLVEGGYRLIEATPFDAFPQTYAIESISIWERSLTSRRRYGTPRVGSTGPARHL